MAKNIILFLVLIGVLVACYYLYKRYTWYKTDKSVTTASDALAAINSK